MIRVKKLMFHQQGGVSYAVDQKLFTKAVAFCKEQLNSQPNLSSFQEVFVSVDEEGEIHSIAGWGLLADVSLFRTKPSSMATQATKKLWDRLNDSFSDRGMDGADVSLFISKDEPEEARCPRWREWLKAAGARASERLLVKVR